MVAAWTELPPFGGLPECTALVELADRLRWSAPELVFQYAQRALAKGARTASPLAVRAQTFVGAALVRLGRYAEAVKPALVALRYADKAGLSDLVPSIRLDLAASARGLGEPLLGCAILRPLLENTGVRAASRAAAIAALVACAEHVGRRDDLEDSLAEAERLLAADDRLSPDARRMERALLAGHAAAYHRRYGETEDAVDAARAGLGLLTKLRDPALEGGRGKARLTLELVCALLDEGELAEAERAAEALLCRPVRAAAADPTGRLLLALASRVHVPAGRVERGRGLLGDAGWTGERHRLDWLVADSLTAIAHLDEASGQAADALRALRSARAAEHRQQRSDDAAKRLLMTEFGVVGLPVDSVNMLLRGIVRAPAGSGPLAKDASPAVDARQPQEPAETDAATGLLTREGLSRRLQAVRSWNRPVALTLVRLDPVESTGRSAGEVQARAGAPVSRAGSDDALTTLAGRVRDIAPEDAELARSDGSELAVLLPHTTRDEAEEFAATIRESAIESDWLAEGSGRREVSISTGFAQSGPDSATHDADSLLTAARETLTPAEWARPGPSPPEDSTSNPPTGPQGISASQVATGRQAFSGSQVSTGRQGVTGSPIPTGRQEVSGSQVATGRQGFSGYHVPADRQKVSASEVSAGGQEVSGSQVPTDRQEVSGSQVSTGQQGSTTSKASTGHQEIRDLLAPLLGHPTLTRTHPEALRRPEPAPPGSSLDPYPRQPAGSPNQAAESSSHLLGHSQPSPNPAESETSQEPDTLAGPHRRLDPSPNPTPPQLDSMSSPSAHTPLYDEGLHSDLNAGSSHQPGAGQVSDSSNEAHATGHAPLPGSRSESATESDQADDSVRRFGMADAVSSADAMSNSIGRLPLFGPGEGDDPLHRAGVPDEVSSADAISSLVGRTSLSSPRSGAESGHGGDSLRRPGVSDKAGSADPGSEVGGDANLSDESSQEFEGSRGVGGTSTAEEGSSLRGRAPRSEVVADSRWSGGSLRVPELAQGADRAGSVEADLGSGLGDVGDPGAVDGPAMGGAGESRRGFAEAEEGRGSSSRWLPGEVGRSGERVGEPRSGESIGEVFGRGLGGGMELTVPEEPETPEIVAPEEPDSVPPVAPGHEPTPEVPTPERIEGEPGEEGLVHGPEPRPETPGKSSWRRERVERAEGGSIADLLTEALVAYQEVAPEEEPAGPEVPEGGQQNTPPARRIQTGRSGRHRMPDWDSV